MENTMKCIFSFFIIGIFLLGALASFGPDESTNTTVAISNCESKPHIANNLHVTIHYHNKAGDPIANALGTLFLTRQTVTDSDSCRFIAVNSEADIATDAFGNYTPASFPFTADNSEDLWRVELNMPKTALYTECKQVQVVKYDQNSITFNCVVKRLNDL